MNVDTFLRKNRLGLGFGALVGLLYTPGFLLVFGVQGLLAVVVLALLGAFAQEKLF